MRYFWTRHNPPLTRVLLIESGSRALIERALPHLRAMWGADVTLDIVTCYAGSPSGLLPDSTIFRIGDYSSPEGRKRLIRTLQSRQYSFQGIVCSAEPIMTKWKWLIAARIPAKLFILNENGDYFWVQRHNLPVIRHFILVRLGLSGEGSIRTIGRLIAFPFSVLFLLLYAAAVHVRRILRQGIT